MLACLKALALVLESTKCRGNFATRVGRLDDAVDIFAVAADRYPDRVELRHNLAMALVEAERFPDCGALGWPCIAVWAAGVVRRSPAIGHAPSSRGSRARLLAAIVRTKRARTRSTPR